MENNRKNMPKFTDFLRPIFVVWPEKLSSCIPGLLMQGSVINMIILYVHTAHPDLCSCISNRSLLKSIPSNHARANNTYRTWAQFRALTLVKQTELWGFNMLGHSTDCLVWMCPKPQVKPTQSVCFIWISSSHYLTCVRSAECST